MLQQCSPFAKNIDRLWWGRTSRSSFNHAFTALHGEMRSANRPCLSTALYSPKPNKVLNADLLYMGPVDNEGLKYVPVIKPDISLYTWIFIYNRTDCEAATTTLKCSYAVFEKWSGLELTEALVLRNLWWETWLTAYFYNTVLLPRPTFGQMVRSNTGVKKFYAQQDHCTQNGNYEQDNRCLWLLVSKG